MDELQAVVIGAGVIGLAVARALSLAGHEVLILEAEPTFGSGVSSRNSEVLHAGIYYPPGSLKARLCAAGRERIYGYCQERAIPHRRCGKLIVATHSAQLPQLEQLAALARAHGLALELLDRSGALAREPAVAAHGALFSAATGIIDAQAYMRCLLADAQAHGALLATRSRVTRLVMEERGVAVAVNDGPPAVRARWLFNCAGLAAPALAARLEGFAPQCIPRSYLLKGSYFSLRGPAPFTHLIYPLPETHSLGIHLTLDLAGGARFGPDEEWVAAQDYAVDAQRAEAFYGAVRRYWPGLPDGALAPGYAGIRPKIAAPGEPAADFRIDGPAQHGAAGVVQLFGIESPGLTASLAIASEALARLGIEA
jgi:L-2-hydroxyglutarate oxidase LhgO